MSIGVLAAVFSWYFSGVRQMYQADFNVDRIRGEASINQAAATPLRRLRFQAARVISSLFIIIGWPMMIYFIRLAKLEFRRRNARARLAGLHIDTSVVATVFAAVLLLLRMTTHADWTIDLGCYLVLASFGARLAFQSLQGIDLPSMMRQNLMHPYLQFALVAVIDYVGLLLASLTLNWRDGNSLTIATLADETKFLATFSQLWGAFRQVPDTLDSTMITIGALSFTVLVIGQLTRFKQFRRTPNDHALIIINLLSLGRDAAARTRLEGLKPYERRDSSMIIPRTVLMIVDGEYDRAYGLIEADFAANSDSELMLYKSRTPDDICNQLLAISFTIGSLTSEKYREIVQYVITRDITDGCLCMFMADAEDFGMFQSVDQLNLVGLTGDSYPITRAVCETVIVADRWESAESILLKLIGNISAQRVEKTTDQVVQATLLTVYKWRMDTLDEPSLAQLLVLLEGQVDPPGWLTMSCCVILMRTMQTPPAGVAPSILQKISEQVDRILVNVTENDLHQLQAVARVPL